MIFQGGHHSRDAVSELDRHGGDEPINCVVAKSSESEAIQSAYVFGLPPYNFHLLHLYTGTNQSLLT